MRTILGAFVLIGLIGCSPMPAAEPKLVELKAGTPVSLILAKQMSAGEAKEGEMVPFLVGEDIRQDGATIIPKGSIAKAEVTWSRSEGTLGGLTNRPARLEVRLIDIQNDGILIPIAASADGRVGPISFTRDNTGKPEVDEAKVEELLKVEANRHLAEKLAELFDGKSPDLSGEEAQKALQEFAKQLELGDTQKLMANGESNLNSISQTISRLQKGDLTGIASGDLSLSLSSVLELANLAGGLGDRVSRSLKGRTIRAYPGTRIDAFVSKSTMLRPATSSSL